MRSFLMPSRRSSLVGTTLCAQQYWNTILLNMRPMAVERGAAPNASEAGAQPREPVVEEDQQGATSDVAQSYERVLAERSGTAEDVRVKDAAKGSLGKMAANPAGVEDECKRRARETVSSMRRSSENPNIADAAMDSMSTTSGLKDRGVTGSEELFPGKSTST